MGGFDLYGRYYPNEDDAINAEMSQCNEIDNRINRQKISSQDKKLTEMQNEIERLRHIIDELTNGNKQEGSSSEKPNNLQEGENK